MTTVQQPEKTWPVIEFDIDAEHEDLASWLMVHLGAVGCEVKPADASKVTICASFDPEQISGDDLNRVRASFEEYGLAACLSSLRLNTVVEDDWLAKWKEGFAPFTVGDQFLICPPWALGNLDERSRGRRHVIVIEPAMAFGTGLHPTTQFCLRAMEKYLPGDNVLDVGTGSGILSIAAKRLVRHAKVVALDTDPQAIRFARIDFELNGLDDIELVEGSTEAVQGSAFETICSNMTCEDILALLPEYVRLTKPEARVFCAGILAEKLELFKNGLVNFPFNVIDEEINGIWAGIVLEKY